MNNQGRKKSRAKINNMSLEDAIATWLVALEDPERITRFRDITSLGDEIEYLTEIPEGTGIAFIIGAIAKGVTQETLEAARDSLLGSKIPTDRLRQIMWRLMKLVRKTDIDADRRRALYQDLLCKSDFQKTPNSSATILPLCRYEESLPPPNSKSPLSTKAGYELFKNQMIPTGLGVDEISTPFKSWT